MDITPKDSTETKALGLGQRIAVALGIVIAAASSLLGAVGGLDWIVDHLPLLGTGLASLVTGAITAYVAVRRMRVDKLANGTAKALAVLCLLTSALILCGCLTRTRCQNIRADTVNVTINCNDPETISENAYPRSLNLFSQDQQVEGGTDSIASGNSTPVSTLPMGDTALEAVRGVASDYFTAGAAKAASAAAKAATGTADAASAAAEAAACSTGTCPGTATVK